MAARQVIKNKEKAVLARGLRVEIERDEELNGAEERIGRKQSRVTKHQGPKTKSGSDARKREKEKEEAKPPSIRVRRPRAVPKQRKQKTTEEHDWESRTRAPCQDFNKNIHKKQ